MSFMKNATKLVDTALCNLYIFSISLGLLVIFFISADFVKSCLRAVALSRWSH